MPNNRRSAVLERGPLILGASGRLGRAFRMLAAAGFWPGPAPLWHGRTLTGADTISGDLVDGTPLTDPRIAATRGVIVLAGVTSGTDHGLAQNSTLALAALALARRHALGPVLLCSSAAVYGRAPGAQPEAADPTPANAYGAAKRAMEIAVAGQGATCLRLANVAGSDQLFAAMAKGRVRLDRFADGQGPDRAYIGPLTLAQTLCALIAHPGPLPDILNVAAPAPVAMAEILVAAGLPFDWTPAPATALRAVTLDTSRLTALVPLPPETAHPATLLSEARLAGWSPAS